MVEETTKAFVLDPSAGKLVSAVPLSGLQQGSEVTSTVTVGGVLRELIVSGVPLLMLPLDEWDVIRDDEAWFSGGEAPDGGVP